MQVPLQQFRTFRAPYFPNWETENGFKKIIQLWTGDKYLDDEAWKTENIFISSLLLTMTTHLTQVIVKQGTLHEYRTTFSFLEFLENIYQ